MILDSNSQAEQDLKLTKSVVANRGFDDCVAALTARDVQ